MRQSQVFPPTPTRSPPQLAEAVSLFGKVFVTHGKRSCHGFAEVIRHELKVPVVVPKLDESFDFEGANVVSTWDSRYRGLNVSEVCRSGAGG